VAHACASNGYHAGDVGVCCEAAFGDVEGEAGGGVEAEVSHCAGEVEGSLVVEGFEELFDRSVDVCLII
jgi:hypothetical protein